MSSMPTAGDGPDATTSLEPSTIAAFSPVSSSAQSPAFAKQRATILVHQKSPLLVSTPPQITRALAYSHPFILPLNQLVGILSWTSGDAWQSFLLLITFWVVVLYGDFAIRWAGPLVLIAVLTSGLYGRHFSPLSTSGKSSSSSSSRAHKRTESDDFRHHKSLDEIVETLKLFTSRCNILLDPVLRLTDTLSTQRSATSASTRPALISLFIRILFLSPFWFILSLPPLRIINTQRVVLVTGTIVLTWHSSPARVARTLLWRSLLVRQTLSAITGLDLSTSSADLKSKSLLRRTGRNANDVAAAIAVSRFDRTPGVTKTTSQGIRFTFVVFENQRRWLGLGWTGNMLAYERAPWTDEELNPTEPKDRFVLPEVEGGVARWQWCAGSGWTIEGTENEVARRKSEQQGGSFKSSAAPPLDGGWIYYDSKWQDGRRGKDGWGRYTRRRKWYRDAELVEIGSSTGSRNPHALNYSNDKMQKHNKPVAHTTSNTQSQGHSDDVPGSNDILLAAEYRAETEQQFEDGYVSRHLRNRGVGFEVGWGIAEDAGMELG